MMIVIWIYFCKNCTISRLITCCSCWFLPKSTIQNCCSEFIKLSLNLKQIVNIWGTSCIKSHLSSGGNSDSEKVFGVFQCLAADAYWGWVGFLHHLLVSLLSMQSCKNSFHTVHFFKFSCHFEVSLG